MVKPVPSKSRSGEGGDGDWNDGGDGEHGNGGGGGDGSVGDVAGTTAAVATVLVVAPAIEEIATVTVAENESASAEDKSADSDRCSIAPRVSDTMRNKFRN